MNIRSAITEAINQNNGVAYIRRRGLSWYLKIDCYGSTKYWNDGRYHTNNYLTLEDFLSGDWMVLKC